MQKILLSFLFIQLLLPIAQLNAQSEKRSSTSEGSSINIIKTNRLSTSKSDETKSAVEWLDELIFKYETVYFETASYRLSKAAKKILERKARWIKSQDPAKQVLIIGHSDQRGSETNNKYLGALRANSVKQFLVSCGIEDKRVRIVSAGETKPLSETEDESAWAKDRRVEVIIP